MTGSAAVSVHWVGVDLDFDVQVGSCGLTATQEDLVISRLVL